MHNQDSLAQETARWQSARRAATFTNRQFVAAVHSELATMGRPDIPFERSWFDENALGDRLLVHVPVGSELTVPLKVMDRFFDMQTTEDLKCNASEFAKALVNLKLAEAMLLTYARAVRLSANAVVADAREQGLDVLLDRVGLKPTYAYHLTGKSWKEAAYHVLAAVTIRHTSFYLRPHTSTVWVEKPAQVAEELSHVLREQRERQDRASELDAMRADLIVDAITLDLLEAHGIDAIEVLTRVWKEQCVNLTVDYLGTDVSLSITSSAGEASASILLPEAFWNGEHLWFRGDEQEEDHKHLIGRSLGVLVPHPAFTSRPVVDVFREHTDHVVFDLSDKVMFDADTGRLRREERLAA
ncbi:hypothetical protein EAH79_11790 [Sphingomonas koreensis]|nr:hypothetical protein EAH79_11790 [Sphingomonas koreensis]